ncbi:MAG: hypothetical protein NW203_11560 [Hyphomonadaceae bacterium]|nr:hypothetical protein [Hyphomonadaceae bacterium]
MNEPWSAPLGREARNEQRKLRGAAFNAVAITLVATALVGDLINPVAAEQLSVPVRLGMVVLGWCAHLFACLLVRDMEDRP